MHDNGMGFPAGAFPDKWVLLNCQTELLLRCGCSPDPWANLEDETVYVTPIPTLEHLTRLPQSFPSHWYPVDIS